MSERKNVIGKICSKGLHILTEDNIIRNKKTGWIRCKQCTEDTINALRVAKGLPPVKKQATETHCAKGHEFAIYGKTNDGYCKECHRLSSISYRRRKGAKTIKVGTETHCVNNHEYAIYGKTKRGQCRECGRLERIIYNKNTTENLSDSYIKAGLRKTGFISTAADASPELIKKKKFLLSLHREIKTGMEDLQNG
jgi:hypothetical protein